MSGSCGDKAGVSWSEIAPCDHLLQLYESDDRLLDALEGFVAGGLRCGDGVIVIATPDHLTALETRLEAHEPLWGFSLDSARQRDQFIALHAEQVLSRFMVRDWPAEGLFRREVYSLLARARGRGSFGGQGRRVRAFGEMVAILWAHGHTGATLHLERLWQSLCESEGLSLFCAYPKTGFASDESNSIREICCAHSHVIAG